VSIHQNSSDFDTSVGTRTRRQTEIARKILNNKSIDAEKNNMSRLAQFCTILHNSGFHTDIASGIYLCSASTKEHALK
jgi:hypothetical protein